MGMARGGGPGGGALAIQISQTGWKDVIYLSILAVHGDLGTEAGHSHAWVYQSAKSEVLHSLCKVDLGNRHGSSLV